MLKIHVRPEELAQVIAEKGLFLKDVAEECGISNTYMSLILSGKRNPSPPVAKKIASALGVKFDRLFFTASVDNSKQGDSLETTRKFA